MPAWLCYPPAPSSRYLRNQVAHVEPLEQTSHRRTGATLKAQLLRAAEQQFSDVAVAKAACDMVTAKHRREQSGVFTPRWIKTGVASAIDDFRFGELP